MQLTVRLGDLEETPEVVYEGALIDEMEAALFAHVEQTPGRYERNVKRWWDTGGREHVEEGLEPLWAGFNGSQLTTWKVYQTIGS